MLNLPGYFRSSVVSLPSSCLLYYLVVYIRSAHSDVIAEPLVTHVYSVTVLPQRRSLSHSEGCRLCLPSHCLLFGFSSALEFLSALHDWLTRWLHAEDCVGADGHRRPWQMPVNVSAGHLMASLLFHFLPSMWGMCLFKNMSVFVEVLTECKMETKEEKHTCLICLLFVQIYSSTKA